MTQKYYETKCKCSVCGQDVNIFSITIPAPITPCTACSGKIEVVKSPSMS
jgi:predicted nucleic acid-binding Zn ribbon protein